MTVLYVVQKKKQYKNRLNILFKVIIGKFGIVTQEFKERVKQNFLKVHVNVFKAHS